MMRNLTKLASLIQNQETEEVPLGDALKHQQLGIRGKVIPAELDLPAP